MPLRCCVATLDISVGYSMATSRSRPSNASQESECVRHINNYIPLPRLLLMAIMLWAVAICTQAQELNAKVTINHQQVQTSDDTAFDELKQKLEEFLNQQKWTNLKFQDFERISCSFNIKVTKYDKDAGSWTCTCMIQANRPVYNSAYTSTLFQFQDNEFNFNYNQFTPLEFNPEIIDNQMLALFAYYAYLIIGMDLDSFSPMGGEDVLQQCMNLTNNAQSMGFDGWNAFDSDKNRFAIINDYIDGAMEPFRQLQYDYYRKGLDEMSTSVERGRTEITTAIQKDLQGARKSRPRSMLPQIWTDYKKDELANIYKGHGTENEKQSVYDILFNINAAQSTTWDKIKQ